MSIEQIAVIGAGTMGNGIAQVCAVAGYQVLLVDVSDAALERGVALSKNLERQVSKGTLDADKAAAAKTRIRTSTDYAQLSSAQLVIEAATENLQLKQRILQQVAANVAADCLIATNTSSLSVTQLAASIEHPERFIGVHFFNPVPMMALVEIIRGLQTSDSTYAQALVVTEEARQDPDHRRQPPGLRGQPHPGADDQRGDLRAPGRPGQCRGHRHRHAPGLQPADRPAGPGRPDWPGHPAGDHGGFPKASTTASTALPRCSRKWSRPAGWGARAVAASSPTEEHAMPPVNAAMRCANFEERRDRAMALFAEKGFGQVSMRELAAHGADRRLAVPSLPQQAGPAVRLDRGVVRRTAGHPGPGPPGHGAGLRR
jgi:prephenate dehydrogenase